jgi:hypothetical protein
MSEGCIGIYASRPTVQATREVHAIRSSQGYLISDFDDTPCISFTFNGKGCAKIGANIGINSQVISIISLESDCWKAALANFPLDAFIINSADEDEVTQFGS